MKTKSALSYFGSDSEVASQLAALLDDCKHVTIPFVGGAAILPHLKARTIVANDLHERAIVFYKVLSGVHGKEDREALVTMCANTLSHPFEMVNAQLYLMTGHYAKPSTYAWAYWATCWIGRKGKGGTKHTGGQPSVRWTAEGGNNASRLAAAAEDLDAWAEHFKRCEWLCEDFEAVLSKVRDRVGCGIYCDPPWVGPGRNYLHDFKDSDHRRLAESLSRFEEATVVVRYGDDPLIRELYPQSKWTWTDAESRTQSNKVKGEVWITNKEPA